MTGHREKAAFAIRCELCGLIGISAHETMECARRDKTTALPPALWTAAGDHKKISSWRGRGKYSTRVSKNRPPYFSEL
jgi:hypothetical protein